jgi:segregation and condensation protein B
LAEKIKATVEAILFASPKGLTVQEISEKSGIKLSQVKTALKELKSNKFSSGVVLSEHNGVWELQIHGDYKEAVKDITKVEFPKSLLETLSIIAYKSDITQSEVIKVRGNKAYGHIDQLEKLGFISSRPFGRTSKIRLAQKFYDYYDISKNELKGAFNKEPEN